MMVDILGKWLTKLLMPTLSRSKTIIRRLRKLVDLEDVVHCTNLTVKGREDDILAKCSCRDNMMIYWFMSLLQISHITVCAALKLPWCDVSLLV
jgi:hypothetical protein